MADGGDPWDDDFLEWINARQVALYHARFQFISRKAPSVFYMYTVDIIAHFQRRRRRDELRDVVHDPVEARIVAIMNEQRQAPSYACSRYMYCNV